MNHIDINPSYAMGRNESNGGAAWKSILSKNSWSSAYDNKTPESLSLENSPNWIHIDAKGNPRYICLTRETMVDSLRLRYRDLVVVDPTLPYPVATVIFIRARAIVVNLDVGGAIRMIICENQCFILGVPSMDNTAITALPCLEHPFVKRLAKSLKKASQNDFEDGIGMPYELIALELALNTAVGVLTRDIDAFEGEAIEQIEAMLRRVDRTTLEGMRNVKNKVDWLQTKVSRLQQEISELLEDDYDMLDLYLGRRAEMEGQHPLSQPRDEDFTAKPRKAYHFPKNHEENEDHNKPPSTERQDNPRTGQILRKRKRHNPVAIGKHPSLPVFSKAGRRQKYGGVRKARRRKVDVDSILKERRRILRYRRFSRPQASRQSSSISSQFKSQVEDSSDSEVEGVFDQAEENMMKETNDTSSRS